MDVWRLHSCCQTICLCPSTLPRHCPDPVCPRIPDSLGSPRSRGVFKGSRARVLDRVDPVLPCLFCIWVSTCASVHTRCARLVRRVDNHVPSRASRFVYIILHILSLNIFCHLSSLPISSILASHRYSSSRPFSPRVSPYVQH